MSEMFQDYYWKSWVSTEDETTLQVAGVFKAPSPGHVATLKPATPQGINPRVLILELTHLELPGVWPDVLAEIPAVYVKKPYNGREYDQVTVRFPNGEMITLDILVLPPQKTIPNYRLVVSFFSRGSGIDMKAKEEIDEYISRYEKEKGLSLAREEVPWGKEGEIDYHFKLTDLTKGDQESFISEIKSLAKKSEEVSVRENVPYVTLKFEGTSEQGDFQEALAKAIAAAKEESNFIKWRLHEVSGEKGGIVGVNRLTVTVQTEVPIYEEEDTSDKNSEGECSDWNAWQDHMPPGPPTLHVTGKCTFPTEGYSVELRPVEPQGINPKIYILERIVHEPTGPVAEVVTDVPIHYQEQTEIEYDEVHIQPDDAHVKVMIVH